MLSTTRPYFAGNSAAMGGYPAEVYPQVTFQQTSLTTGLVYKTRLKKDDNYRPSVIEVDAKTMKRLELARRIIDEIQATTRTGNQWIDIFPDGSQCIHQEYARNVLLDRLRKKHPELSNSQRWAVATALTGAENCGGIAHLAIHKLLENGADAPVSLYQDRRTGHEFAAIGDPRMEKVIKVEAWAPFGTSLVISPDYLQYQTEVLQTERPANEPIKLDYNGRSLNEIEKMPAKDVLQDYYSIHEKWPRPGLELVMSTIETGRKYHCFWNMLFGLGPEDPATQYRELNAMPVSFNQKTVRYWEDRYKNQQKALDDFMNESPSNQNLMKAAGYRAEGSEGK